MPSARADRGQNHSCDPNCKIFACYIDDADVDKPLLAVFTTRDVAPWEELCLSYFGDVSVSMMERAVLMRVQERWAEAKKAEKAREVPAHEHAVYALECRCEADNCIGRLFH